MLIFIDETWQNIGGRDVGALAAIAIPRMKYNAFCREVWAIKQNVLGADQLSDCEIKGNSCFARSAFRAREHTGHSTLLQAAEETLSAIPKYGGAAFATWTDHPDYMLFRNPNPDRLSPPTGTSCTTSNEPWRLPPARNAKASCSSTIEAGRRT